MKKLYLTIPALALIGCAGPTIIDPLKIPLANKEGITIQRDPFLISYETVAQTAQDHCQAYGKDAVATTSESSITYSFTCK